MASPAPSGHYSNRGGGIKRFLQGPIGDLSSLAATPADTDLNRTVSQSEASNANNKTNSQHSGPGGDKRDVEQRLARIVAEYEYKLLEERGRAQEKESRMSDELQRLKQQVEQQHLENQKALSEAVDSSAAVPVEEGAVVSKKEYEQVKAQLSETRELLQESDRRYQQEKRELLNVRTAQLRSETSKRGQEGDIIGRAMQVMSEYESVVRGSEENSLARLSHHMDTFEKEWLRRAREFDEQKSEFELSMLEKTRQVVSEHHKEIESVSRAMVEKTTQMLRSQSDLRLEVEEQVLRHAEVFKEEYKQVLDKEFYERCRLYDEKLAERERGWVKVLQDERRRIVAAEQQAVQEHEALHVQALEDAMRDLSRLREQLVQEHHRQQAEAMKDLVARRESLQRDHDAHVAALDDNVRSIRADAAAAIAAARDEAAAAHKAAAAREAAAAQREHDAGNDAGAAALSRAAAVREEVEAQWSAAFDAERERHAATVARLAKEHQTALDSLRDERCAREDALLVNFERRAESADEAAEARWGARVAEALQCAERHAGVAESLRAENAALSSRVDALQRDAELRAAESAAAAQREKRAADEAWHARVESMRQRYDALLDEALGGPESRCVSRVDYDAAVAALHEWEEKCTQLRAEGDRRVAEERASVSAVWAQRVEAVAAERAAEDEDRARHFAELRAALAEEEERRAESEAAARRAERSAMEAELSAAVTAAAQRTREAIAAASSEAEARVTEARAQAARNVADREAELDAREANLREERRGMAEAAHRDALARVAHDEALAAARIAELRRELEAEREAMREACAAHEAETDRRAQAHALSMVRATTAFVASQLRETADAWLSAREEELHMFAKERVDFVRLAAVQRAADREDASRLSRAAIEAERDECALRDAALESHRAALLSAFESRQSSFIAALREALDDAARRHAVTDAEQFAAQQIACARAAHDAEAQLRLAHDAAAAQLAESREAERRRHRDDIAERERRHAAACEALRNNLSREETDARQEADARHEAQMRALEDAWAARLRDAHSAAAADREKSDARAEEKSEAVRREAAAREAQLRAALDEAQSAAAKAAAESAAMCDAARREAAAQFRADALAAREAMDEALATFAAEAARRDEAQAAELREAIAQCAAEKRRAAEKEAEERAAREAERRNAEAEREAARASDEEQRLAAVRAVEEQYARLFAETHSAAQKAREEWARQALGEEERRLAQRIAEAPLSPQHDFSLPGPLSPPKTQAAPLNALTLSPQKSPTFSLADEKLSQLWAVLEVPEGERLSAARRWAHLPATQRAEEIRKETRRLEVQLPLLEVVTRREFVLHRLWELEKSAHGGVDHSAQIEELQREGRKLTEHLRADIPRHEAIYGSTFCFRGERYMDTLLDESIGH